MQNEKVTYTVESEMIVQGHNLNDPNNPISKEIVLQKGQVIHGGLCGIACVAAPCPVTQFCWGQNIEGIYYSFSIPIWNYDHPTLQQTKFYSQMENDCYRRDGKGKCGTSFYLLALMLYFLAVYIAYKALKAISKT